MVLSQANFGCFNFVKKPKVGWNNRKLLLVGKEQNVLLTQHEGISPHFVFCPKKY